MRTLTAYPATAGVQALRPYAPGKPLSELEREQYDLLLEEQALPYEDQAIDILIANVDLVEQDIYDDWVKQSFAELAKLLPGRFAKFEQVEDYVDIIY